MITDAEALEVRHPHSMDSFYAAHIDMAKEECGHASEANILKIKPSAWEILYC